MYRTEFQYIHILNTLKEEDFLNFIQINESKLILYNSITNLINFYLFNFFEFNFY